MSVQIFDLANTNLHLRRLRNDVVEGVSHCFAKTKSVLPALMRVVARDQTDNGVLIYRAAGTVQAGNVLPPAWLFSYIVFALFYLFNNILSLAFWANCMARILILP